MSKPQATQGRITEAAYDAIESMIATLQLPPGQPIIENDLVQAIGIGRTPVREALMQLVATGLIEQQQRRGLRVSDIHVAEHLVLLETRRLLERLIATSSARRATPAQRRSIQQHAAAMTEAAARGDLHGYMQGDQAMDHVNHEACRNPFAVKAVVPMIVQCRRFWYAFQYEGDLEQGAACHMRLAEGIAAADPDRAAAGADELMDYLAAFTRKVIA